MNKYLLTSVMVLALALTIASTASAEEGSLSTLREKRQEFRDSQMDSRKDIMEERAEIMEENREAVDGIRADDSLTPEARKDALKAQWEDRKASFGDLRQARMAAFASRVAFRLEMAIARIEKLSDRLTARLDILEEKGKDVSDASDLIDEAKTAISEAKIALADFQAKADELADSATPKELVAGVREASQNTVEKIRAAHTKVVEAIKSVKSGSTDEDKADKEEKDKDEDEDDSAE